MSDAAAEILINVLDLLAFALVTPEVIGRGRLPALFSWMERSVWWLRSVWLNRDLGAFAPAYVAGQGVVLILALLAIFGLPQPAHPALFLAAPTVLAVLLITMFGLPAYLVRRTDVFRAFAIIGALLFVAARLLAIANAYGRL